MCAGCELIMILYQTLPADHQYFYFINNADNAEQVVGAGAAAQGDSNVVIALAGNKADLQGRRRVCGL